MSNFTKIDANGQVTEADDYVAVLDESTGLIWDRREFDSMTGAQFDEHIKKLNAEKFGGFNTWRKPECDELLTLVDRTKYSPAIDTDAFPNCKNGWYRTATPYAPNPSDFAWVVGFGDGNSSCYSRNYNGCVRACVSQ